MLPAILSLILFSCRKKDCFICSQIKNERISRITDRMPQANPPQTAASALNPSKPCAWSA